ncbi:MAG: hypothetical protein ACKVZH_23735 [Blastocatellia bacterium]
MTIENQPADARANRFVSVFANPRLRAVGVYFLAILVCVLIVRDLTGLRRAYLSHPFLYQGDALFYHIVTKGVMDHGWFLENPSLNAPEGLNLRDVPTSDNNFYFLVIKLLGLFTTNYQLILNLFYLLSFPLTVIATLYVWRQFKLSWPVAVGGALLFTFLPFHHARGQHHLFLSSYYLVPLAVLVVMWICWRQLDWQNWREQKLKLLFALIVCALLGSTGYYFAFFVCFLLLIAGALAAAQSKNWRALLLPGLLIAVTGAVTIANLWPSVNYFQQAGAPSVVERPKSDADLYGLRIAQMLLPISFHPNTTISELKSEYNQRPGINENDDASLGLIGSLGFLYMLVWLFFRKPEIARLRSAGLEGALDHLSLLTISSVLLATVGGFSSLVAFFLAPQVRAYTRISIFIAFFAIFAALTMFERLSQRMSAKLWQRVLFWGLMLVVAYFGAWESYSLRFTPRYDSVRAEFEADGEFIRGLETRLPAGAMIFQLPVAVFPENPKIHQMLDYDLARGFLHSRNLRWSYGAIKGRESELWQRGLAEKPPAEMAEALALGGFSGIYLDRNGYPDRAAKLESELTAALSAPPLANSGARLSFFDLRVFAEQLRAKLTSQEWESKRDEVLNPLFTLWRGSFSFLEKNDLGNLRWAGREGELVIVNRSTRTKEVMLEMGLGGGKACNLTVESEFFSERLALQEKGSLPFSRKLILPPGKHSIRFHSDGQRILTPGDYRELVFYLSDFKLTDFKLRPVETPAQPGQILPTAQPTAKASAAQP